MHYFQIQDCYLKCHVFILVDLLVHVFDGLETPDKKMEALAKKYIQLVSICFMDLFNIKLNSYQLSSHLSHYQGGTGYPVGQIIRCRIVYFSNPVPAGFLIFKNFIQSSRNFQRMAKQVIKLLNKTYSREQIKILQHKCKNRSFYQKCQMSCNGLLTKLGSTQDMVKKSNYISFIMS